ncbi:MAG: spore maturation protein [Candidatus Marinimicrobia bacterium]|nr:spore maturation protein [Candidatus Neomarinimicrobiota bacterium]
METFVNAVTAASAYIIPLIIVLIPGYALTRRVKVYEEFVEGAKEGFTIAVRIIPYLVAILVAIGMFRASGAMDFLVTGLQPLLGLIGFPPENLPLALMRPLSGSGSLALLSDLVTEYGVESIYTRIGATMYNSSETTFYVLAVYFGSVGIRRTRHAVLAGLLADLAGALSAVFFCKLLFG